MTNNTKSQPLTVRRQQPQPPAAKPGLPQASRVEDLPPPAEDQDQSPPGDQPVLTRQDDPKAMRRPSRPNDFGGP